MSMYDLADLVGNLPPGCALWRATGGDLAWSAADHKLAAIEYQIRNLQWMQRGDSNSPKPEPWEPPPLAHEVREEAKVTERRAERYLQRQRSR